MNKADLIATMAEDAGISKEAAERAINSMIKTIKAAVNKNDTVTLMDFGSFLLSKRAPRLGRDPRTGEPIQIKAARVPKFKPGKGFKNAVG